MFKEKLATKIKSAQAAKQAQTNAQLDRLLENEAFVEVQRSIEARNAELDKLDNILTQLNNIPAYQAKSGDKFSVRAYSITDFAPGVDRLIGIVNGARSAFVNELALNYSAITGISMLELELARTALGTPAYFSKGQIYDAVPGNLAEFNQYLESIAIKLGIFELASKVDQKALDVWFMRAQLRAEKAKAEFDREVLLNSNQQFTIED